MNFWRGQLSASPLVKPVRLLSRRQVCALRDSRLRALVAHAYANVPYYRRLFDAHAIEPKDIRGAADLKRIPVTTKDDLRSVPVGDTVARGVDPAALSPTRTSGSSGEPFTTWRSRLERFLGGLFWLRAMGGAGVRLGDRSVCLVDAPPDRRPGSGRLRRLLAAFGIARVETVSCVKPREEVAGFLQRYQPDCLIGYSGAIAHLAAGLTDTEDGIRPRVVIAGGDVLTPQMRYDVERSFGTRVRVVYGSQELNLIAWQCPSTGELHTCDDGVVVEVLDGDRPVAPGERGELIGTNLHFYAMPFIRYRLGDVVTAGSESCGCGQPFATICNVAGRTADYLPLPGGRWLHPYRITDIALVAAPWIRRHQVVQERADAIALNVVPLRLPSEGEVRELEQAVQVALPGDVAFRVALVREIVRDAGGKYPLGRPLRPG